MQHLISGAEGKRYLPFYTASSPFCSYFPEWFKVDGKYYLYAQQYFYAEKARFHGHLDVMRKIQQADCSIRVHTLGSQLAASESWEAQKFAAMYVACYAKFEQNGGLRRELLRTVGAVLVNCDQRDCEWGVGLRLTDERVAKPNEWRGRNLLGECLMAVRTSIALDHPSEISVVFPSRWR